MADQLPVAVGGGALTVEPAGAMQLEVASVAGAVGDVFLDRGSAPEIAAAHGLAKEMQGLWTQAMAVATPTQDQLEWCEETLARYRPHMAAALKFGDTQRLSQLATTLEQDLVIEGALTSEQIEKLRPVFRAASARFEAAVRAMPRSHAAPASASPADEMRRIEAMMSEGPSGAYWYSGMDPQRRESALQLQARWRELHEQGVTSNERHPTPPDRIDGRIDEIEKLMGAAAGTPEYKQYWNSPAVQAEYLDLITQRDQRRRL